MAEPYIASIQTFACNFAPRNYALCSGQLLAIAQNTALFSLVGTYYGGNGQTNFALPNMVGRAPMHWGSPPGLTPTDLGEEQGTNTVTLITTEMPMHNHTGYAAAPGQATERTAAPTTDGQSYLSNSAPAQVYNTGAVTLDAPFAPSALGVAGGGQPHENMQPYLVLNMCIALAGVFPPRG